MTSIGELLSYGFMVRALLGGVLLALTAPLIGSFLVPRKLSLVADTFAHTALVGVAIAAITHAQPLVVTMIVTTLAALLIETVRRTRYVASDAVLALLLPGGLALSLVLLSTVQGVDLRLLGYLFGSITTVTEGELWLLAALTAATWATLGWQGRALLFAAFDEDAAQVAGIPVRMVNMMLMVLTALTVSLALRIVGVMLIGALMIIPVVTAVRIARGFWQSVVFSVLSALLSVVTGIWAAFSWNTPAGATIVLLALIQYVLAGVVQRVKGRL